MATVIDTLFIELGIDASKFSDSAQEAVDKLDKMEKAFDKSEAASKKAIAQNKKNELSMLKLEKAVGTLVRGVAGLTAVLLGSSGLTKLATDAAKANRELDNLSRNLGMSSKELSAWQGAAGMAGGSAEGLSGYMQTLSGNMTSLVMMGDTSMLPFFNALGVSILDSSGKARKLDDVMLDLADSMSGMDRVQAFNLAKQMGMDDGTANTLLKGRQEVERMLALQNQLYRSNEADLANSQKLMEVKTYLNQQWESLLLMIGNALMPTVIELTEVVSKFMGYLIKNERRIKAVFFGMATAIGLALIPVLIAATAAAWAFIAPFLPAILAITALGAAFALLYEDYLVWSEGGKSLFDWGKFINYIQTTDFSVDNLKKAFAYLVTGYTSWSEAGNALFNWLRMKGFIDETGVSVNSLKTGFANLAAEIRDDLMPYLQDIVDIFMNLKDGNLSGAWESLKRGGERRINAVKGLLDARAERVAGTIDVATGHNPNDANSMAGAVRGGVPAAGGWTLGDTSRWFETRNRGAETISSGKGDRGGVSYGSYQMSSNLGVVQKFLQSSGYQKHFAGMPVNSAGFKQKWKELAKNDPAFSKAQHDYIQKTHYDPLMKKLNNSGIDLSNRGAAVKDAVWSTSVQFGGGSTVIQKALKGKDISKLSDADIVKSIQGYKYAQTESLFRSSPSQWGGLRSRAKNEEKALLELDKKQAFLNKIPNANTPLVGHAVATNLQKQQAQIDSSKSMAKSNQVVHNNRRTDVVVQNVNVNTSSSTMRGVGGDIINGINNAINQLNPGMV